MAQGTNKRMSHKSSCRRHSVFNLLVCTNLSSIRHLYLILSAVFSLLEVQKSLFLGGPFLLSPLKLRFFMLHLDIFYKTMSNVFRYLNNAQHRLSVTSGPNSVPDDLTTFLANSVSWAYRSYLDKTLLAFDSVKMKFSLGCHLPCLDLFPLLFAYASHSMINSDHCCTTLPRDGTSDECWRTNAKDCQRTYVRTEFLPDMLAVNLIDKQWVQSAPMYLSFEWIFRQEATRIFMTTEPYMGIRAKGHIWSMPVDRCR